MSKSPTHDVMRAKLLKYALLASVTPAALLGAVRAQTTTSGLTQASQPSVTLQEVTVSVARRSENLQKVPETIQVVSGAKIASQALTNIGQIVADVPGVQATGQPQGFSINIRGMASDGPSGQTQGAVALENDGVYNITSVGTTIGFFDLDRLEVLPGPQSTEYGPNADGGVIDVVSKDPVISSKDGYATLTVGNYSLVQVQAAQNIPLTDVLAARVAGTAIYRNSYLKPAGNNNIGQGARAKILYRPNDSFSAKLAYEIDHVGGTGTGFEVGGPPTQGGMVPAYAGGSVNNYSNPWNHGDTSPNGVTFGDSQTHLYQNQVSLTLNDKLTDWLEVNELAAFLDIVGSGTKCGVDPANFGLTGVPQSCSPDDNFYAGDTDTGNGRVYPDSPFHSYSSETRLQNAPGSPIDWNFGFYHWSYTFAGHSAEEPEKGEGWTRTTTNAFFGQATYPITSALRITGGLRDSMDQRQRNQDQITFADAGGPPNSYTGDKTLNLNHVDYLAGIEYDLTPQSMEYFKYSTGYRPASLTYNGGLGVWQTAPDEVNHSFEFGSKNRFLDNTLQANLDIFYEIVSGYQSGENYNGFTYTYTGTATVPAADLVPGTTNVINCSAQASRGNIYCSFNPVALNTTDLGFEGQLRYNVTPDDQVGDTFTIMRDTFNQRQTGCATYGLSAAELASGKCYYGFNNPVVNNALQFYPISGAQLPHSPTFAQTFTYSHIFELPSGSLKVGGEVFFSTDFYVHPVEAAFTWQPSYEQYGLNFDYTPLSGRWDLSGYVHNLTNYAVKESALPVTTLSDPRTFGVNINYKW